MKKFFTLIAAVAMAASVNAQSTTKAFTKTTVFITNVANVEAAVEEGWIAAGVSAASSKKGSVDPNTGEEGEPGSYKAEGVMLKLGNDKKCLTVSVSGVSSIVAYGATASSSEERTLLVTATPENGESIEGKANSQTSVSAVAEVKLDATKTYKVNFTGVKASDMTSGADVALHGIKFVVGPSTGITSIESAASAKSTATYNLAGQQVSDSYKGIVIKNGKKYLNKK